MTIRNVSRREGPGDNRLHRIAYAMLTAAARHPEADEGVRVIAFVTESGEENSNATTALGGYEDDVAAMADLLVHLTAMFKANGLDMQVFPVGGRGQG